MSHVRHTRPRVYVAGPYTMPDPCENVRRAVHAADELELLGCHPVVPHLSHLHHLIAPRDYGRWLERGLEELRSCDALVRLHGESPGADIEVALAVELGLPVFHTPREDYEREVRAWAVLWAEARGSQRGSQEEVS